jgi:hypothetical protein
VLFVVIVAGGLSFAPCTWVPCSTIPFANYLSSTIGLCIGEFAAVVRKDGMVSDSQWKQLPWDATFWPKMFQLPDPTKAIKVIDCLCTHICTHARAT